ncbi:type IV pilus secretin PilQ [Iodobacter ciconiae]|uniref:Type IV pilus biogenesis and competence protein PilQ n=1 Tax=Iodobacter ciconiae TaxID=2496266 RepID=A0A3S8ZW70_9NEIS|nr:type IV pilus secretin PilQ [Iodobacter ciconiae]AZN37698.1 type IV pilus secretin PilQ [Iodobacter ciconiae]
MKIRNIITSAILSLASFAALAASSITAVDISNISADKQIIRLSFTGPAPVPTSFSVNTPPRVAFDFADTTNQAGKSSVQVNGAALRLISLAEGSGRTRVVLNMQKQAAYQTRAEGNDFYITVDGTSSAVTAQARNTHFADNKASEVTNKNKRDSIENIDFRRGKDGEGKVVIDLSSPNVGIDIRQQGKMLLVDFSKAALPKKLERRMDVTDFGTPIQKVDAYTQGETTKMVIEPKGNWEYSAYQTENRFIVEVREVNDERNKQAGIKPAFKGEKLSLNFQNVEIRTVLQVIAEFTGLNIITSDTVTGNLTLRLKDVPWDQALDMILQAKGLDQRKNGSVLWVAPREELASKEKQELESRKQIDELEPTRTEAFQLRYQKAEDLKKMLSDDKQQMLSKRGSIVIDSRTNTLFVQDISSKLEQVRAVIGKIDVAVRQVQIEARIVEANDGFSRELGVKLGWGSRGHLGNTDLGLGNNLDNAGKGIGVLQSGTTTPANNTLTMGNNVNLPAIGSGVGTPGTFALIAANANWLLGLEISALAADNKGKIISSPRLVTADQVEASIESGEEIPYQESSQNGATTISFKKATLSLKVTPQITPDGNVIMKLNVTKDSRGTVTLGIPSINTKQINTTVLVENGGTVVIGGIYTQEAGSDVTKVPLLGDIPYLGHLFKNTLEKDIRRELLIFISPKVIQSDLSLR